MLIEIDIKKLIEQFKAIQKMQENKIEEYKVMKKEEFAKLYKKYLNEEVRIVLSQ